jgi:uncharacterized protein YbjT (DUF2867 family)
MTTPAAAPPLTAMLAGASGLVGKELLALLCASAHYSAVHSLVRRASGRALPKLTEHVIDFEALPELPACDDVYIALGTTIKQAGSQAAFRRVDHDYVVNVARAALARGARRLGLVSAVGADPASRIFYNRVKGETQADVAALGYDSVVIVQPSLLLGDRAALGQPTRAGEVWASHLLAPIARLIPASFRPVSAADVARSLVEQMLDAPRGTVVVTSRDIHAARQ